MIQVTIRQLEYATATARFGGVTAAADALHISQPALSVALAQLEAALGQPLFLRRPGGQSQFSEALRAQVHGSSALRAALEEIQSRPAQDLSVNRLAALCAMSPRNFARVFRGALERGVYLAPSAYEAGFISTAHDGAAIDRACEVLSEVIREL
jgi:DNA-binding transcriptional LysR family regulator